MNFSSQDLIKTNPKSLYPKVSEYVRGFCHCLGMPRESKTPSKQLPKKSKSCFKQAEHSPVRRIAAVLAFKQEGRIQVSKKDIAEPRKKEIHDEMPDEA